MQQHPSREQRLRDASQWPPERLLAHLSSHADGLTQAEASARLARHGHNLVDSERPLPGWLHLWHCWRNPFSVLLTVLATVSWLTRDHEAALVIGGIVALATGLRFLQEGRSNRAAERLKAMVGTQAAVLRRHGHQAQAQWREVPASTLVVGDHVQLSAGDLVPADCRVLAAKDLYAAQSALTGESMPVPKSPQPPPPATPPLEAGNLLIMGTSIVSGTAQALVVATGRDSYLGELAAHIEQATREDGPLEARVNRVSWLLVRFAAVMVPVVLLANGFTKGDWPQAALFALSVAVGLTPELLPMIVTSTLAKGAVLLSRRRVIVKRLDAIQVLGAMDVLCTDKTGTLTQDRIVLQRWTGPLGDASEDVLRLAVLNSHHQTGLRNLLDRAVLEQAAPRPDLQPLAAEGKVDEVPFDFERRRMSVVVARPGAGHLLVCKGAAEELLAVCTTARIAGQAQPLDQALQRQVHEAVAGLNHLGLRVVAVATRAFDGTPRAYGTQDESAMTLEGYVAFLDPPNDTAAPALQALARHGVQVKVLTGDSDIVATEVCRQVGLPAARIAIGRDLDGLDAPALARLVRDTDVFARMTPLQKERVVQALRSTGHVVGFLGDGINDAPALRAADVGISVDGAVDIAREAADVILLEKSLTVLDDGVVEGRRTFCNLLKYIRMTASSNFGNVLSVVVASVLLPFLPMLPLHLLLQNLLYDFSQGAIPFDNVDDSLVQAPLRWDPDRIARFMLWFGPVSSLFDLLTFAMLWFVLGADAPDRQRLFQSGWFVEGLLTQVLVVHTLRTPGLPWRHSRPSATLALTTLAVAAIGLWLPFGPLAPVVRLQPLPAPYWPWLAVLLAGYVALVGVVKRAYVARHGWS